MKYYKKWGKDDYLEQAVSADPNHKKEIRNRFNMGWGALRVVLFRETEQSRLDR